MTLYHIQVNSRCYFTTNIAAAIVFRHLFDADYYASLKRMEYIGDPINNIFHLEDIRDFHTLPGIVSLSKNFRNGN